MTTTTTCEAGPPRDFRPTRDELVAVLRQKYGDPERFHFGPRTRLRHGYFTPEEYYEVLVARLIGKETTWLDVGCGRSIFPFNPKLSQELADRCKLVVGVDPDATLDENPHVHEKVRGTIEDLEEGRTFSVATLRMVAEHIAEPAAALKSLARVLEPGGKVVVYTVNRWTPVALAARLTPHRLHHTIKRLIWQSEEKDTFPVVYRMNTHKQLTRLFDAAGFQELSFTYLDDCRTFARFRWPHLLELKAWRVFQALRLHYPENCLLGVYERRG